MEKKVEDFENKNFNNSFNDGMSNKQKQDLEQNLKSYKDYLKLRRQIPENTSSNEIKYIQIELANQNVSLSFNLEYFINLTTNEILNSASLSRDLASFIQFKDSSIVKFSLNGLSLSDSAIIALTNYSQVLEVQWLENEAFSDKLICSLVFLEIGFLNSFNKVLEYTLKQDLNNNYDGLSALFVIKYILDKKSNKSDSLTPDLEIDLNNVKCLYTKMLQFTSCYQENTIKQLRELLYHPLLTEIGSCIQDTLFDTILNANNKINTIKSDYLTVQSQLNNLICADICYNFRVAVVNNDLDLVKFILEKDADKICITNRDKDGNSPILLAVNNEDFSMEIFKLLLSEGAVLNDRNKNNDTLFGLAASNGNVELVKFIKENLKNIDYLDCNNQGLTAFHLALINGNVDCINFMMKKMMIDVSKKDNKGYSALTYATLLGNIDIVDYLIVHYNANWKELHNTEGSLLSIAVSTGKKEIVEYFLNKANSEPLPQNKVDDNLNYKSLFGVQSSNKLSQSDNVFGTGSALNFHSFNNNLNNNSGLIFSNTTVNKF